MANFPKLLHKSGPFRSKYETDVVTINWTGCMCQNACLSRCLSWCVQLQHENVIEWLTRQVHNIEYVSHSILIWFFEWDSFDYFLIRVCMCCVEWQVHALYTKLSWIESFLLVGNRIALFFKLIRLLRRFTMIWFGLFPTNLSMHCELWLFSDLHHLIFGNFMNVFF